MLNPCAYKDMDSYTNIYRIADHTVILSIDGSSRYTDKLINGALLPYFQLYKYSMGVRGLSQPSKSKSIVA